MTLQSPISNIMFSYNPIAARISYYFKWNHLTDVQKEPSLISIASFSQVLSDSIKLYQTCLYRANT